MGAPSEDRPQPRILSRSSFGSTSGCVPEETHIDADYDWKTSQVLKVRQIFFYALTVRLSLLVSDLEHEVSVRQQRLRGNEEKTECEYVQSDCADTGTYPRIILEFIRSRLSGIQTHNICLFNDAPRVSKNAIFKTWNPKRC